MTTKGDNKTQRRAEAERLIFERIPHRLPQLLPEFAWACGARIAQGLPTPPPWVRYAIRRVWGIPDKKAHAGSFTPEQIAELFGLARGLIPASQAALKQPIDDDDPELAGKLERFRKEAVGVTTPQWKGLRKALAAFPESKFHGSIQEVVAFHRGQHIAAEFVAAASDHKAENDSLTEELLWFLWLFWPEVETAKSIAELHQWLSRLRFVACSQKLLEKICTQIGLRPSARGRKRRASGPPR